MKKYRFTYLLLLSVIIGSILGLIFEEDIVVIKPFGDLFLNMMFTIVVPLVFFTISSSVASMLDLKRLGKIFKYMFLVFIGTCLTASIVMLIGVLVINPVSSNSLIEISGGSGESTSFLESLVNALTVSDFNNLLSRSHMLALIIFSVFFGIGCSSLGREASPLTNILNIGSKVMMKLVKYIMYYAPIGLCAYFAALVGEFGTTLIASYVKSFLLYCGVGLFYYLVFYSIYAYIAGGKKGVKVFWENIIGPTLTALATQSSLATLPTSLEATKDMGVSKDVREVVLPIGSTMNMHGSVMSAILKIAFVFSLFNIPFSGFDIPLAILISILSGVVMSGIPGGGLIGEMLIVSLYGLPAGAFAVISTIGIIIDAPATAINVCGNPVSAMLVSRFVDKDKFLAKIN